MRRNEIYLSSVFPPWEPVRVFPKFVHSYFSHCQPSHHNHPILKHLSNLIYLLISVLLSFIPHICHMCLKKKIGLVGMLLFLLMLFIFVYCSEAFFKQRVSDVINIVVIEIVVIVVFCCCSCCCCSSLLYCGEAHLKQCDK